MTRAGRSLHRIVLRVAVLSVAFGVVTMVGPVSHQAKPGVHEQVRILVEAATQRGEALDHVLLHGPPGLGKTTLAQIIANEMGVNARLTSGPALEHQGMLASILTSLEDRDVFFIDEVHRLNRAVEEALYPAMEDLAFDFVAGKGAGAQTLRLSLSRFTVIGATTRAGALGGPLRDDQA